MPKILFVDTSVLRSVPREKIADAFPAGNIYLITEQEEQECQSLTLPPATQTIEGYVWGDFKSHGEGFYTLRIEGEPLSLQDVIPWEKRLKCGCLATTVFWYEGATIYACVQVTKDQVDFSLFLNCLLTPEAVVFTSDKHLGWAPNHKALFGVSVDKAWPWSDDRITPQFLADIERGKKAFNGVTREFLLGGFEHVAS